MDVVRIIIAAVLLFFFIAGLRRGLIRQVLEVLGLIAAFIGAFYLAHHLAVLIEGRVDVSYRVAMIIAALLIFAGIIVLFHFVGLALQKLFKMTVLGAFDRVMGGVFGALKGVLLVSLVLVIILSIPLKGDFQRQIREDTMTGMIYPVLPVMFDLVVSRSGLDFDEVLGIGRDKGIGKLKKNAGEIKEKLEEERSRLD